MSWTLTIDGSPVTDIAWKLAWSFSDGERLDLSRPQGRHDATTAITNNNRVVLAEGGVTRFDGWVREPMAGGVGREGVVATAYGPRWRLMNEVTALYNGSTRREWSPQGSIDTRGTGYYPDERWTVGEALVDFLEHWLGLPGGGSALPLHHRWAVDCVLPYANTDLLASYDSAWILANMTDILPTYTLSGQTVGQVIQDLVSFCPNLEWYIDPATKALVVQNASGLTIETVAAGEIGHHVEEGGKGYALMDNEVQMTLNGVKTSIVIQGCDRTEEIRPSLPGTLWHLGTTGRRTGIGTATLIKGWDPADEAGYDINQWRLGAYVNTRKQDVWRIWKAEADPDRCWYACTMTDDDNNPYAYGTGIQYAVPSGTVFTNGDRVFSGNPLTTYQVDYERGTIIFAEPRPNLNGVAVEVWTRVYRPFTVGYPTSGFGGTAYSTYGLETRAILNDENWEHKTSRIGQFDETGGYNSSPWPLGWEIHDDTADMLAAATSAHGDLAYEVLNHTITFRCASLATYNLTKRINVSNLAKWGSVNWYVSGLDFEILSATAGRMTMYLTNRIGGCKKYDESYWAAIAKQKRDIRFFSNWMRRILRLVYTPSA